MSTSQPPPDLVGAVFEGHPAPTFVVDGDAGVLAMNRAARLMLGRERDRAPLELRRAGDVLRCVESYGPGGCGHQEQCKSCVVRNAIVQALSTGSVQRAQTVMPVRGEGGDVHMCLLVNASPILHGGSELVVVTLEDVSDVVRLQDEFRRAHQALRESEAKVQDAEERLRETEQRLELAMKASKIGFFDWNLEAGELRHDPRFHTWPEVPNLLRGSFEEITAVLAAPEDLPRLRESIRRDIEEQPATARARAEASLAGQPVKPECRRRTGDGRVRWLRPMGVMIERDPSGRARRLFGTVADVTELRELQERAVRAERLASVATLVRGVCHEVNNPLGSLLPNLSYAREQIVTACGHALEAEASGVRAYLEDVERVLRDAFQAADRVREIVADLKTFTSGDRSGETRCELRAAVDRALELATHELAPCADVEVEIPAQLPQLAASCAELAHVFASLLANAGQATAGGKNTVRIVAQVRDPEQVVVEVSDTGTGIDESVLPRVFDPFFSTRGVGRGKGLGLSVCLGIVRSLGGDIALRSVPGKGTTVTVVLPRQERG
jgi:signal transduction histidine kinase